MAGTTVTMISSPGFSAFGPLFQPEPRDLSCAAAEERPLHCLAILALDVDFIVEWGLTSRNALNAPVTFASFPSAYTPARE